MVKRVKGWRAKYLVYIRFDVHPSCAKGNLLIRLGVMLRAPWRVLQFVKAFRTTRQELFEKALHLLEKALSSLRETIFPLLNYFISTASTPSKVIFTGLMKPFSSNSILSMQTSRSLAAFLSNGRRW